ncbi:MAG: UDP-2,4-diacetamido-2,4,6-trideoxy-beta-L-altropyranose hydrolase [Elusimicrobia bacterium]|nr:UDP-2,4-diacetamido-2,4,6-trideoxy-beta-L-altropyranose hydrolase [Elusimicrobiota bacterium]
MKTDSPVLVIRADAGPVMGTGHIMRCIALGQAWRARGGRVVFLTANNLPSLLAKIRQEKFRHVHLRVRPGGRADAVKTAAAAGKFGARWVVVDGYQFDSSYREILKKSGFRVLWVDDLGSSGYCFSDIIINQNLHAQPSLYPHVEAQTRMFLGPRFAMLREEFGPSRQRRVSRSKRNQVLIFGGGTDHHNMTKIVLSALKSVPAPALEIDVILGGGYQREETLIGFLPLAGLHRVRIRRNPPNMAELLARADVAIVAAGSIVWEIARLGLPALLIVQAENQTKIARSLHRIGASLNLGHVKKLFSGNIQRKLLFLLKSVAQKQKMASCGRRLVDGRGASRVVRAMAALGMA